MESLIPVISKLQDVFATVGHRESEVQLPQIVVVGSQSAGKSSVIEGIVGRDFLPRGTGIVTRRPLLLHLVHVPLDDARRRAVDVPKKDDWAVFEHKRNAVFTDFSLVRQEIEQETERVTGSNKGISDAPITLRIFSHKVVNLSLIDLPGITKLPVGDQPPDIEGQITNMILSYIQNPNSLILAVTPANQDFATSEPLKLARDVDKDGDRTLAVLTKLDLMDRGTDAIDVLTGRTVPVKLGIIGVVNRSQADIQQNKPIEECLKDEARFLLKHYPTLASRNGIQYLAKTLNRLLIHHIRECLPQLKARVSTMIAQCRSLLNSYGEPVNIETNELCGGARISYIFHGTFLEALEAVDPMEHLSMLDVLTAIRNATGTRPDLFIPVVAFELLVKRQIERLIDPSICCVDLVYEELMRIVQQCGLEVQQEMQRFPRLYERINEIVSSLLSSRLQPTKRFVTDIVNSEMAYINTKHPDFTEFGYMESQQMGGDALKGVSMCQSTIQKNGKVVITGDAVCFVPRRRSETSRRTRTSPRRRPPTASCPRSGNAAVEAVAAVTNVAQGSPTRDGGISAIGSWLFSKNMPHQNGVQAGKPAAVPTTQAVERSLTRNLTQREQRDYVMFERLIRSYFAIVRRNCQDLVPKGIMRFMVNHMKENLQSELVQQLYSAENMDDLLAESDLMAQRRKESVEMLEALQKANLVIAEIREHHIW
ncbi:Dynamin central region family protein [Aphelenchoides fujianensis]|nr:Dynamin central region family protein [Aphelenchoides fujianensis]